MKELIALLKEKEISHFLYSSIHVAIPTYQEIPESVFEILLPVVKSMYVYQDNLRIYVKNEFALCV